jgi:hypothetical protein
MKLPIVLIPLLLIGCATVPTGCDSNQPQTQIPTPSRPNFVIDRETVVSEFKTAEVQPVPYQEHGFIARDRNGTVWYVNVDPSKIASGKTRLFAPIGTNGVYEAEPDTVSDKVMELYRTMIEAAVQMQLATNKYSVTNVVYTTNVFDGNETLPPQMGARIDRLANRLFREFLRTNSTIVLESNERAKGTK